MVMMVSRSWTNLDGASHLASRKSLASSNDGSRWLASESATCCCSYRSSGSATLATKFDSVEMGSKFVPGSGGVTRSADLVF